MGKAETYRTWLQCFGETVVLSGEESLCVDIEFESAAKLSATFKLKAGNAWVKLVKPSLEFESPAYFIRESGYWTAEKITNVLEAGVYVAKELPMRFYRKLDEGTAAENSWTSPAWSWPAYTGVTTRSNDSRLAPLRQL
jgi:hypothetical protein